jgi:hypothetical protein
MIAPEGALVSPREWLPRMRLGSPAATQPSTSAPGATPAAAVPQRPPPRPREDERAVGSRLDCG